MKKSKLVVRWAVELLILAGAVLTVGLTIAEDVAAALARKAREGISRTDAAKDGERQS